MAIALGALGAGCADGGSQAVETETEPGCAQQGGATTTEARFPPAIAAVTGLQRHIKEAFPNARWRPSIDDIGCVIGDRPNTFNCQIVIPQDLIPPSKIARGWTGRVDARNMITFTPVRPTPVRERGGLTTTASERCDRDTYDDTATSNYEKCARRLEIAAKRQGSLAISFDLAAKETVILMPQGVEFTAPAPVPAFRVVEARFTKKQYDEADRLLRQEATTDTAARQSDGISWAWSLDAATGQIALSTDNAEAFARLEAAFPGLIRKGP